MEPYPWIHPPRRRPICRPTTSPSSANVSKCCGAPGTTPPSWRSAPGCCAPVGPGRMLEKMLGTLVMAQAPGSSYPGDPGGVTELRDAPPEGCESERLAYT